VYDISVVISEAQEYVGLVSHTFADGFPAIRDPFLHQASLDACQQVIGQDTNEKMACLPAVFAVMYGSQSQFTF
jgi:hypothetical protein